MGNGTNCKTCILCDGTCNKTCESALITGLQEAEYFKGCHYINGSLNIKIFDEISNAIDITEELEKSLGNITEIKGYLRVYRSTAITSLNFLKNLKVIHGEELYNEKYSFVVFEMSNLQVIFDWDTKKNFTIEKGTLFFNENVKLCLKEIRKLANITGVTVGEHDVCSTSNGFKQFCSRTKMTVENVTVGRNFAVISWKRVNRLMTDIDKSGETLGYLIHYMQHSGNNITTHHGIDSCSRVGWKVKFIPEPQDSKLNSIVYNLTDLTPITKYAFYIQTYNEVKDQQTSVSSEEGESDVHYFKTKISRPPSLEHLAAFSHTENSLTLFWIMSGEYSEIVVQYLVEIYIILDEPEIFDKTNYCKQRFKRNRVSAFPTNFQVNKNYLDENVNCKCRDEKWQKKLDEINERYSKKSRDDCDETEEDETVKTYKDLQKDIDCGYLDKFFGSDHDRFPRNTEQFDIHEILNLESNPDKQIMENVTFGNKYHSYSTYFSAEHTNYTIDNLKHFGKYVIHLAACVEEEGIHCGMAAITSQRTLKHPSADNIGKISTKIYNSSAVAIEWEEPKDPNGIVLSYILQYKRVDTDVKVLLDICITRLEHEENHGKYFLWNLSPGIYSVRVKTRSLGNEGEFSKWTDFVISENVSTIVVLCLLSICLIVAYAVIYLIRLRNSINNDDIDALVTSETYLPASVRYETQMTNEGVEFCNSY